VDGNKINKNIAIIGASGAIGHAMVNYYAEQSAKNHVTAFSRSPLQFEFTNVSNHLIDFDSEESLSACAKLNSWDIVVIAIGILTDTFIQKPEKTFKQLNAKNLQYIYKINTVYPVMTAKNFLQHLKKEHQSTLAILSARVGSISDNHAGGWHSYRASKAALNMFIKNFSIEMKWVNKLAVIIGLHPGTVDSNLSKAFQSNIPEGQLFTPIQAATYLTAVIDKTTAAQSGCCIAWDGKVIPE
jgi:NAD(P)-dependent dehydrogenase (short-subunit alcohol dehydrogenase family)